jgi:2,4-dienoyl-CoA reductase-like NADH-dependent reductase (Old Yellow Enzyme family)
MDAVAGKSAKREQDPSVATLFRPYELKGLVLPNRIVMAPMTRRFSPGHVPDAEVAAYYRRRAEGGVGLIMTEGTYLTHASSGPEPQVPRMIEGPAESAWRKVTNEVHAVGGRIFCQLWHIGLFPATTSATADQSVRLIGPSGLTGQGEQRGEPMTDQEIADLITAYATSAEIAKRAGFDGIELHGAHGYLIDQFFWAKTNRRTDAYGGADLLGRTRFAVEVLQECRRRVGPDFPISFRFSQWKIQDYAARLAPTPDELERFLAKLVDAGADVLHCSTRRYWEPEFEGSDMNLAGWTKKLTGMPTISVGSVTLSTDVMDASVTVVEPTDLGPLTRMMERGDFDLIAVGRAVIANPTWPQLIRHGQLGELKPFSKTETNQRLY